MRKWLEVVFGGEMGGGSDRIAAVLPREVSLRHFGRGLIRGAAWGTALSALVLVWLIGF